jgi:hypothetical protein
METPTELRPTPDAAVMARPAAMPPQSGSAGGQAWRVRVGGAAVAVAAGTLLAVAAWLPPKPDGMGTHTELGLPPCGFLVSVGIPCPTCGMTTAFTLMVHGHPLAAVRAQPAGAALSVLTVAAAICGVWTLVQGRIPRLNWDWPGTGWGLATMGLLFFGGWAWKIVDYLLTQRG